MRDIYIRCCPFGWYTIPGIRKYWHSHFNNEMYYQLFRFYHNRLTELFFYQLARFYQNGWNIFHSYVCLLCLFNTLNMLVNQRSGIYMHRFDHRNLISHNINRGSTHCFVKKMLTVSFVLYLWHLVTNYANTLHFPDNSFVTRRSEYWCFQFASALTARKSSCVLPFSLSLRSISMPCKCIPCNHSSTGTV